MRSILARKREYLGLRSTKEYDKILELMFLIGIRGCKFQYLKTENITIAKFSRGAFLWEFVGSDSCYQMFVSYYKRIKDKENEGD